MCTSAKGSINQGVLWPHVTCKLGFPRFLLRIFLKPGNEMPTRSSHASPERANSTHRSTHGSCSCQTFFCNMIPKVINLVYILHRWIPISLLLRKSSEDSAWWVYICDVRILYLTLPFSLPVLALYPLFPVLAIVVSFLSKLRL